MKKMRYKLHFKAQDNKSADNSADSFDSLKETITKHFTEQGLAIQEHRLSAKTWAIVTLKSRDDDPAYIRFDMKDKVAESLLWSPKSQSFSTKHSPFEDRDLEFLDKLGFDLSKAQKEQTGQSIEDWYLNKANDQLTQIELVRLILTKTKAFGYKLWWSSLIREKRIYRKTEKELNKTLDELPEDFNDFETLVLFNGIKGIKGLGIVIDFKNMTIKKMIPDKIEVIKDFTDDELKFFDSLGFKTSDFHKQKSNQDIEDWYLNKAFDELSENELLKIIEAWYKKQPKVKLIEVNPIYLAFEYYDEPVQIEFNLADRSDLQKLYWNFKNGEFDDFAEFTDDELRFFDKLGFELSEAFSKVTDQKIEDWYLNKAFDELTLKAQILRIVEIFKVVGYKFCKLKTLNANKRTSKELTDLSKLKNIRKENNEHVLFLENDKKETIRFTLGLKLAEKDNALFSRYVDFTNEELKLIDSLDFDLAQLHKTSGNQAVEDWFKALDALSIEEFLVSEGYTEATEEYLERDLIDANWIVFVKSGPLYSIAFGVNKTEKLINKVGDYEAGDFPAVEFTKAELKYFDAIGYLIEDRDTEQNIEDWFKAEDEIDDYTRVMNYMASRGWKEDIQNSTSENFTFNKRDKNKLLTMSVLTNDREIQKILLLDGAKSWVVEDFTNEELKFFDSVDYMIDPNQSKATGQSIDDWYIKALDAVATLDEGLVELGYKLVNTTDHIQRWVNGDFTIFIYPLDKEADKSYQDSAKRLRDVEFTNRELYLLDSFGYKLTVWFTETANQTVEDWWSKKANDQLTKFELVKLIISKSKSLGYRFNWLSLKREDYSVIQSEEALNNLPKDFDNFWTLTVISDTKPAEAEVISVSLRDMTVDKTLLNHSATRDFTNEELKFFDSLGFKLGIFHKKHSNQEIEDWYLKANDQLTQFELVKSIMAKMESLGYKFNWLGLDRDEYSVIESEEELNKTLDELPDDFNGFRGLSMISGNVWEREEAIDVNFTDMTIEKILHIKASEFTNEELKFFDSLGFKLSEWQKRKSPQEIEDWYLKANDRLTKFELLRIVMTKLKAFGYRFYWLGLEKEDYISIRTEELLNETLKELPEDFDNFYDLSMVLGTNPVNAFEIEVNLKNMTLEKIHHRNSHAISFTDNELKFFDSLGFEMSSWQKRMSPQRIEDWYLKGLDALPTWQILRIMEQKMKDLGYNEVIVTTDEILIENHKDLSDYTDEELKAFADDIVRIAFYNSDTVLNAHVRDRLGYEKDKEISKYKINTSTYVLFTNEELKFFDSLGYVISRFQQAFVRGKRFKQEITDWYTGGSSNEKI